MAIRSLGHRYRVAAVATAACLTGVVPATATPATASATGRICGASRCVALPRPIAIKFSQRESPFEPVAAPRTAPFYRITVKGTGEGFISETIIWVPTAHALWMKEHVYADNPAFDNPGYWRTDDKASRAALTGIAEKVRPFPKPTKWILPR